MRITIDTIAHSAFKRDDSAIRRVRCADQRPRGWHGGRDYDQGQ